LKVAFTEIGGCGGCSLSFLRASAQFPENWELVYHPLQLDVSEFPDDVDILFAGGAVCAQDNESIDLLALLREKSKTVVAFGSCAAIGGIMRFFVRGRQKPKQWQATHLPLSQFIKCDLSVVGCPPPPQSIKKLISNLSALPKTRFDPFKKMTEISYVSCFNLLDEVINAKLCVGCGLCEVSCPTLAIQIIDGVPEFIVEKCIRCGVCYARCPQIIKKWKRQEEQNAKFSG